LTTRRRADAVCAAALGRRGGIYAGQRCVREEFRRGSSAKREYFRRCAGGWRWRTFACLCGDAFRHVYHEKTLVLELVRRLRGGV